MKENYDYLIQLIDFSAETLYHNRKKLNASSKKYLLSAMENLNKIITDDDAPINKQGGK